MNKKSAGIIAAAALSLLGALAYIFWPKSSNDDELTEPKSIPNGQVVVTTATADSKLSDLAAEQDRLKEELLEEDDVCFLNESGAEINTESGSRHKERLKYIGGVDISFVKGSEDNACASLVVLDAESLQVVYESYRTVNMPLPYIAGFLAFREVPVLLELVKELRRSRPELEPGVTLVDGSGVLHPRGFGLACHLGVLANMRTIGVAKTFLNVDGLTRDGIKAMVKSSLKKMSLLEANERKLFPLTGDSGRTWGMAVCPNSRVTNPIYVSVGHRIDLKTAVEVVLKCSLHRIPEPVRQADIRSRSAIRELRM
mmetsp:Transcript_17091/g.24972  ORF Transcript_17091/g.24972 Transcript_17091/m.24972 type:complete len:313 (-) Transcript_17091:120-1058(-)